MQEILEEALRKPDSDMSSIIKIKLRIRTSFSKYSKTSYEFYDESFQRYSNYLIIIR